MIGTLKVTREFIECGDRHMKTKHCDKSFTYLTTVVDTAQQQFASLAMVHGFAENQNAFFETALHHALNGFHVALIDLKGFGNASGPRSAGWTTHCQQENVGALLQKCPTDKPLFIQAHSMGCMVVQNFLAKNKANSQIKNIQGVIYGAPFFEFAEDSGMNSAKMVAVKILSYLSNDLLLNPELKVQWICHDRNYWRKLMRVDATCAPFITAGCGASMVEGILDVHSSYKAHTLPLLVMTAQKEKIVSNTGANRFYTKCATPKDRKQIKQFFGAYHELHKEPE